MVPGVVQFAGVGGTAHARLRHPHRALRDERCHPGRPVLVDLERDEVPLVHADQVGAGLQRPLQLRFVVHLDEDIEADLAGHQLERSGCVSAATISSTQSAPIKRASQTSRALTVKSLRSTGSVVASRAAARSAGDPPKNSRSVRTDSAAAPPA